ncbi:hypothetical protein Z043_101666 [Scleropages formosus]|uniref:ribonuclease H n=1 Tax=Scleropages formosus TaxID=113540 RepID=A0A0P7VXN9_SCLFO|nr:hypothetical protein Z043_101666 [Scleropages formosus]
MLRSFRLYSVARRALCLASGDMAKGKFFYAVRKGSKPGVYRTWDECKVQVLKFPAASYKKFSSEKEAWAFVRGAQEAAGPTASRAAAPAAAGSVGEAGTSSGSSKAVLPAALPVGKRPGGDLAHEVPLKRRKCIQEIPIYTCAAADTRDGFSYMGDAVVVYTDGCCSRNGNRGARAGIGVYWGPDHPLNVAERLQGIQTNQRAELQASSLPSPGAGQRHEYQEARPLHRQHVYYQCFISLAMLAIKGMRRRIACRERAHRSHCSRRENRCVLHPQKSYFALAFS